MFDEIRPLQEKQLQILKELKRVCDKNDIQYFLFYGTLIGAVRHNGFIPWDDDIDVAMTYENYCKFAKVCKTDLNPVFFLQNFETQPESGLTFQKLRLNSSTLIIDNMADRDIHHGIDIDIYPIYSIADNKIKRKIQFFYASLYLLLCVQKIPKNNSGLTKFLSKFILFFFRGKTRERLRNRCHKKMVKYENKHTKYKAGLYGSPKVFRVIYPSYLFDSSIEMEFEKDMFSVPKEYDACLKLEYGDYMKMPPAEQQGVKLEHIVKLDTDNSYLKYKGEYYCTSSKK